MAKNRIAQIRKAKGLSQRDLAEKLGAHFVTVSKLERGHMQLTMDWANRLKEALDTTLLDLVGEEFNPRTISISGVLGEGNAIYSLPTPKDTINLRDSSGLDPFSYWYIVKGDALWPIFHEGDLLRFLALPQKIGSML